MNLIKTLVLAFFVLFYISGNGQDWKTQFDTMHNLKVWGATIHDESLNLGWGEGKIMRAYLKMYKATGDKDYLNWFVKHSQIVMKKLNDNPYNICNDYYTWSRSDNDPYDQDCWRPSHENFLIMLPMAEYIHLVKKENPKIQQMDISNIDGFNFSNQGEYANSLFDKIKLIIDEFNGDPNPEGQIDWWEDFKYVQTYPGPEMKHISGFYKPELAYGSFAPLNMAAPPAMVHILLSDCLESGDPLKQKMLMRAVVIVKQFKNVLIQVDNHYEWPHSFTSDNTPEEDISHGSLVVEMAYMSYKYGLKDNKGQNIFELSDMNKFARTITESVYCRPFELYNNVQGTNHDLTGEPTQDAYKYSESVCLWLMLSEFSDSYQADGSGKDIYHIAANIMYNKRNEMNNNYKAKWFHYLANLYTYAYKSKFLQYSTIYTSPYRNSNWRAVDVGDFNKDGKNEVVCTRNSDSNQYIYQLDSNGDFAWLASNHSPVNADWAGIAAGDLSLGDGKDEFVAVSNASGNFTLYRFISSNSTIDQFGQYHTPFSNPQWAGVAAGNFDGEEEDEFVAASNKNGNIYIYRYKSGKVNRIKVIQPPTLYPDWAGIAAGDFDGDGVDEFVVVSNKTGRFYLYSMTDGNVAYTEYTTYKDWESITAGNFDNNTKGDELLAINKDNGDAYLYNFSGSIISEIGREYFLKKDRLEIIGSGNLDADPTDEIVCFRNINGNGLVFDVSAGKSVNNERVVNVSDETKNLTASCSDPKNATVFDFVISPNPSSGLFELNINDDAIKSSNDTYKIVVRDINGSTVYESIMRSNKETIDLSNQSNGIYFIHLQGKNNIHTTKIIKQK